MRFVEDGSPFELYGRWNSLVASSRSGSLIGHIPAHDGDFFPESAMDYVEAVRKAVDHGDVDFSRLGPVRVDIDITQICNASCTFCFSRPYQQGDYKGQWARKELLKQVIADIAIGGGKSVRFCGGGDPMVHPDIAELLPLVHHHGMRLCVISNLDFLDADLASLICDHVDHLRWSVNAATDRTRVAIHRPQGAANLLSTTVREIGKLVARRERSPIGVRRPMIWATFLILPNNVEEMLPATRMLRDIGVDSVSFRPVYHGLGGRWKPEQLDGLQECLNTVAALDDRPRFCVFIPKRDVMSADALDPKSYFGKCISRRVRTVLEATSSGLALQSCGMYRGAGAIPGLVVQKGEPFPAVWSRTATQARPVEAPGECSQCIDVSMNITLAFIAAVLKQTPDAVFRRAWLEPSELK